MHYVCIGTFTGCNTARKRVRFPMLPSHLSYVNSLFPAVHTAGNYMHTVHTQPRDGFVGRLAINYSNLKGVLL